MKEEETPDYDDEEAYEEKDKQAIVPRRTRAQSSPSTWSHTPSQLTLFWMAISLPLVIWDTGYMLGRPHTMTDGKWNWPLWVPYQLYATVDYVYGVPHYEEGGGWGPAQAFANAIETALYFLYLYVAFSYGKEEDIAGRGAPKNAWSLGRRKVVGREAGVAVLVGFTTAVMTMWKTVLYCESWQDRWSDMAQKLIRLLGLIEYFSGFQSIGHNDASSLLFLWIIPK